MIKHPFRAHPDITKECPYPGLCHFMMNSGFYCRGTLKEHLAPIGERRHKERVFDLWKEIGEILLLWRWV